MDKAAQALKDWLEAAVGGSVVQLERHVARREAWLCAVEKTNGGRLEGFLRIERHASGFDNISLEREARICQALSSTPVPVPAVHRWDPDHKIALFQQVEGSAAIDKLDDPEQQRQVMVDFIDAIAELHQLEPAKLQLGDALGDFELSPADCALGDLNNQLRNFKDFLAHYHDPLLSYGVQWLRRFMPASVHRVSLVQGDTGPVNFMFSGDKVSAIVDWEWGHWGDPMEDLGNICVREFWNPSGGLKGLFNHYEQRSGIPYDRDAVQYYRVQQNVRGMIPIHAVCQSRGLRESMAWYLTYRYLGDRATIESIAMAMGIALDKPDLPPEPKAYSILADAAIQNMQEDIGPELQSAHARSRLEDTQVLLECIERRARYGAEMAGIEQAEMAELLGVSADSQEDLTERLCQAIEAQSLDDEVLIKYLLRRAYREEWLHKPVTRRYPDRTWSEID